MKKSSPSLKYELELWKKGFLVIGIDEVGRGAFAGPLCVGGVIFKPTNDLTFIDYIESLGINDSKKVSPTKRKTLSEIIRKEAFYCNHTSVDVPIINKIGIGKATQLAVRKLVKSIVQNPIYKMLSTKYYLLSDAFNIKYIKGITLKNQTAIIKGDSISLSIAAASIIAKVERDDYMTKLSLSYPHYKLHQNKGYGTQKHRVALEKFGPADIHRIQFIKNTVSIY